MNSKKEKNILPLLIPNGVVFMLFVLSDHKSKPLIYIAHHHIGQTKAASRLTIYETGTSQHLVFSLKKLLRGWITSYNYRKTEPKQTHK